VELLLLVALLPLQEPEAVQEVALVELQVRVEAEPLLKLVGVADSETVGAGLAGVAMLTALDGALSLAGEALS